MTIPGVDAIAAISIVAAVGDFTRVASPGQLVSYVGLNPKVRQSGSSAALDGRISKAGRSQVRVSKHNARMSFGLFRQMRTAVQG